jgi:hypothetical protein
MRLSPLLVPVLALSLLVGGGALHKYSISIRGRAVAEQLRATAIDLKFDKTNPESAFRELERGLKEKNEFFRNCRFEFSVSPQVDSQIWLNVTETSGLDCLRYVTELAALRYHLQPGKIIVTRYDVDTRDVVERTVDDTVGWLKRSSHWASIKLGLHPPPPSDPFAPPPELSLFPFVRESP